MQASCRSPPQLKTPMRNNTFNSVTLPTATLLSPPPLDEIPFSADLSPSFRGPPLTSSNFPVKDISSSTTLSHTPRLLQNLKEENDILRFKLVKSKESCDRLERRIVHQEESFRAYQSDIQKELRWWKSKCHTLAQRLAAEVLDGGPPPLLDSNCLSFSVPQNFLSPTVHFPCTPSSPKTMRTSEERSRERDGILVDDRVGSGVLPSRSHQNFSCLHDNDGDCRIGCVHCRNSVDLERDSSGRYRKDTHGSATESRKSRRESPAYFSRHSFRQNSEDKGNNKCRFCSRKSSSDYTLHDLYPECHYSSTKSVPASTWNHQKRFDEVERSENKVKNSMARHIGSVRSTRFDEIISFLFRSQQEERLFAVDLLEGMVNDLGLPQKRDDLLPSSPMHPGMSSTIPSPLPRGVDSNPHLKSFVLSTAVSFPSRAYVCALLTRVSLGLRLASAHWIRCLGDWCGKVGEYVVKVEELEETIVEGPLRVLYEDFLADAPSPSRHGNNGMDGTPGSIPLFSTRKGGKMTDWEKENDDLAGDISALSDHTRHTTTTTMATPSQKMRYTSLFSPSGRIAVDTGDAGACSEEEGSASERVGEGSAFSGARRPLARYPFTSTGLFSLCKPFSLIKNGYETVTKADGDGMDGGANRKNGFAEMIPPSFAHPSSGVPAASSVTSIQWCADVLKACVLGLRELKSQLTELCRTMVNQPPLLEYSRMNARSEGTEYTPTPPSALPASLPSFSTENLSSTKNGNEAPPMELPPSSTSYRASPSPLYHRLSVELMKLQQRSAEVQEKLLRRLERDELVRLDLITRQQQEIQQIRRENVELFVKLSQSTCQERRTEGRDQRDENAAVPCPTKQKKENASLPRCLLCRSHSRSSSLRRVTPERVLLKANASSATAMSSSESSKEPSAKENKKRRKKREGKRVGRRGMQVDQFSFRSPRHRRSLSCAGSPVALAAVDMANEERDVRRTGSSRMIDHRHHPSHRFPHRSSNLAPRRCHASHPTTPHRLSMIEAQPLHEKRADRASMQKQESVWQRRTAARRLSPEVKEPMKRDVPLLWAPQRSSMEVSLNSLESGSDSQSTLSSFPLSSTASSASTVHSWWSSDAAAFSSGASSISPLATMPPLPPKENLSYQSGVVEGKRSCRRRKETFTKRTSGHTMRHTRKHSSSSLAAFSTSHSRQAFRSRLEQTFPPEPTVIDESTTHREGVGTHAAMKKHTNENTSHCLSWKEINVISSPRRASCSPVKQGWPLAAPDVETERDESQRWEAIKEAMTRSSPHEKRLTASISFRDRSFPLSSVWRKTNQHDEAPQQTVVEGTAFMPTTPTLMRDDGDEKEEREKDPEVLKKSKPKKLLLEEKHLVLPQRSVRNTDWKESATEVVERKETDGRWFSNEIEARKRAPLISPSLFSCEMAL